MEGNMILWHLYLKPKVCQLCNLAVNKIDNFSRYFLLFLFFVIKLK